MESIKAFFDPSSVAVIGATEKAGIGRTVISNILSEPEFRGKVYPVNPTRPTVMGVPCYATLQACPTVPDLVVIVTPAKTVPDMVGVCVDLGVKAVVVISSGFKEVGPAGKALEDQISAHLRRGNGRTRVVGPNCFGVMCTATKLNATFATQISIPGKCAMISQSGAMVCCILDWAMKQGLGFSSFVSVGSMLDVDWSDLLEYYAMDDTVRVIMIYMETIGNARNFLNAARRVSRVKPIILLKAGRTAAAAKAAVSHTGSLAGSDDAVDAALKLAGVIRVDTSLELFQLAEIVSTSPVPRGPRFVVLTHAGGPGVIASDALSMAGGVLADIPKEVIARLDPQMPPHWSMGNPMDITGGATADMYQKCLDELGALETVDGIVVFVGPLAICPPTTVASNLKAFAKRNPKKTIVACFLGGDDVEGARNLLRRSGVPVFTFSDEAARSLGALWRYRDHLDRLFAAPERSASISPAGLCAAQAGADALIASVRSANRTVMTEAESKQLLRMYGIPVSETIPAANVDDAVKAAEGMGFPVAVKLHSETITHKSDVGGVILNVGSAQGVKDAFATIRANIEKAHPGDWQKHFLGVTVQPMLDIANGYEVLLGANNDPQFGPVVVFGTGGKLVEVYRDRALTLPPLTRSSARMMMAQTRIYKALLGTRGQGPVDMAKLESVLVAFGDLLLCNPLIKELDINPLFCSEKRICAIDARVVLWSHDEEPAIPRPAMEPYPIRSVVDHPTVTVRPLRSEDSPMWAAWRATLAAPDNDASEQARIADLYTEYSAQLLMAAVAKDSEKVLGACRVTRNNVTHVAEIAVIGCPEDHTLSLIVAASVAACRADKFVTVKARKPSCPKAIAVFEAAGFKQVESDLVLTL